MKKRFLIATIFVLTFHVVNAQKKIFNKEGELKKIVDKRNNELGYWTFPKDISIASIYVIGKENDAEKNGVWEAYYENGKPQELGEYKNNKKEGLWKKYHNDGIIDEYGTYRDGLKNGNWIFYYNNGFTHLDQLYIKASFSNDTLNGDYERYYSNGKLEMIGNHDMGYKTGKWSFYHENGQLQKELTYINQEIDGVYKSFHENGVPFQTGQYEKGRKTGKWFYKNSENVLGSVTIYDNDHKRIDWYFDNGKVKRSENYKYNGKSEEDCKYSSLDDCIYDRNGEWLEYFKDGKVALKMNYKGGELNGLCLSFGLSGNITAEGLYENGKKEKLWKYYYNDGKIKEKGNYIGSYQDGKWYSYYENGNLYSEGNYKVGLREGEWKYYYQGVNGKVKEKIMFSNDRDVNAPIETIH